MEGVTLQWLGSVGQSFHNIATLCMACTSDALRSTCRMLCLQGPEWMESLDKSFGYLGKEGYCYQAKCHVFPIAVGK